MFVFAIKNDLFFQVKFYKKLTFWTYTLHIQPGISFIACLKSSKLSLLGYLVTDPIFLVQGLRYFQFHYRLFSADV